VSANKKEDEYAEPSLAANFKKKPMQTVAMADLRILQHMIEDHKADCDGAPAVKISDSLSALT
jgi:hypothetical protein